MYHSPRPPRKRTVFFSCVLEQEHALALQAVLPQLQLADFRGRTIDYVEAFAARAGLAAIAEALNHAEAMPE